MSIFDNIRGWFITDPQNEAPKKDTSESQPEMIVLNAPAPKLFMELNPRVIELEKTLDELYNEMETHRRKYTVDEWDKREKDLIARMVDEFVKSADKRMLNDVISGSRR